MAKINVRECGDPLIWEAYHTSPMSLTEAFDGVLAQTVPLLLQEGYKAEDLQGYYVAYFQLGVDSTEAEQGAADAFLRISESDQVEGFAELMARKGLQQRIAISMRKMIEQREGEA